MRDLGGAHRAAREPGAAGSIEQAAAQDRSVRQAHQQVRGALQDTSSLPVIMFDACDPMTEAVLAQAAATVFLDHMQVGVTPTLAAPGEARQETVTPEDIRSLCARLEREPEPERPSLMGGITRERLWVLLDLVVAGSPGARINAAARLHETITMILDPAQLDPLLLGQVAALLQEACLRDDMPPLMRDLLRQAVERQLDGAAGGTR